MSLVISLVEIGYSNTMWQCCVIAHIGVSDNVVVLHKDGFDEKVPCKVMGYRVDEWNFNTTIPRDQKLTTSNTWMATDSS